MSSDLARVISTPPPRDRLRRRSSPSGLAGRLRCSKATPAMRQYRPRHRRRTRARQHRCRSESAAGQTPPARSSPAASTTPICPSATTPRRQNSRRFPPVLPIYRRPVFSRVVPSGCAAALIGARCDVLRYLQPQLPSAGHAAHSRLAPPRRSHHPSALAINNRPKPQTITSDEIPDQAANPAPPKAALPMPISGIAQQARQARPSPSFHFIGCPFKYAPEGISCRTSSNLRCKQNRGHGQWQRK